MREHAEGPRPSAGRRWLRNTVARGVVLALWALAGCASPSAPPPSQATPPIVSAPAPEAAVPRAAPPAAAIDEWDVDLERDERRGGHTIARHVGRTEAQLQARLRRESISAASTYPDLETAERVVAATLTANRQRVQTWVKRSAPKPNLAVRHRARDDLPTGRLLRRGDDASDEVFGAVVVLRWRDEAWYVLTSYPENVR